MNVLLASLTSHAVQQAVTTLLDLAIAAAIPFAIRYVNSLTHLIKDQRLQEWVSTQVMAVEQQFAGILSSEDKRQKVILAVRARFPKVPESVIRAALEASVAALKTSTGGNVTVPVQNADTVNVTTGDVPEGPVTP